MKKQMLLLLIVLLLLPALAGAHTLMVYILDNEDGTLTVEGRFNTGQTAEGALIRLESLVTGEVLFKQRLPQESELTVTIPDEPYQVVLDAGPGHTIVKEGIPPQGGFAETYPAQGKTAAVTRHQVPSRGMPGLMQLSIGCALVLLLLTLYFSHRNTQKLLKALQNNTSGSKQCRRRSCCYQKSERIQAI